MKTNLFLQIILTLYMSKMRLDEFCVNLFKISRSMAQNLITKEQIYVNNIPIMNNKYNVKSTDIIEWKKPKIYVDILYEENDFYIINKPSGVSCERHITTPKSEQVLTDLVNGKIVNRLDKPTSGIMIIPKTMNMYYNLKQQFRNHIIKKQYIACFNKCEIKSIPFNTFICEHNYRYFGYIDKCFCNIQTKTHESIIDQKYTNTLALFSMAIGYKIYE